MKKKLCLALAAVLTLSLAGCTPAAQNSPVPTPEESAATAYTAGTYEASFPGRNGDVTVAVTLSDNSIDTVTVTAHQETDGIADLALTQVCEDIVTYQSLGVDGVTGATFTSNAIIRAATEAIQQGGGDTVALTQSPVNKTYPAVTDLKTQIVVVGGGVSGMMAAIAAADQGMEVVLLEKLPYLGGSFLVSAAVLTTVDGQHTGDNDDSLDHTLDFVRQVNSDSVHQPDYDFLGAILSQTGKTVDYLIEDLKVEATSVSGGTYTRTQFTDGVTMARNLERIMNEKGISVIKEASATQLLTENNSVTGVKVVSPAGEYTVTADKVIVATGGASWDRELMQEKNPELATVDLNEKAGAGNSGDGIKMLQEIGAQVDDVMLVKSSNVDFAEAMGYDWRTLPRVVNQLIVDAEGKRFANESPLATTMLNTYFLRHPSKAYYGIFDSVNTDPALLAKLEEMSGQDRANIVVYAETIEELAGKINVDPADLRATFDRYQSFCVSGIDEDYGKPAANLIPYAEEGGYYAAYLRPASWGTIGGVMTDEEMRVLRADGSSIENVFAVGETATSRLFGDYYLGGFSLGLYSTMGRIAAETAAAEIQAR